MESEMLDKKIELIQWVSALEDADMLQRLIDLKKETSDNWWVTISDEEKTSIEKGIEQAKQGKLTPHSEVRKHYEKWI
ncbi:MAG: hypothetical protein QM640_09725 [Niabella sp.]